jgi:hypothetical protein
LRTAHRRCCAYASAASPAEAAAVEAVVAVTSSFTRLGLDGGDRREHDRLTSAVYALYDTMPTEPPIAEDPRLVGDWQLLGSTTVDFQTRKGITGLGAACGCHARTEAALARAR